MLKTSRMSIARMHSYIATHEIRPQDTITQSGTRPISILCCLEQPSKDEVKERFDFVVYTQKDSANYNIAVIANKNNSNLSQWFNALNHVEGKEKVEDNSKNKGEDLSRDDGLSLESFKVFDENGEVPLLTLNLQLNQLLMLINNPMLFPHKSYADMFNEYGKEE